MRKYIRLVSGLGPRVLKRIGWINKYAHHPECADIVVRYAKVHDFLSLTMNNFRIRFYVGGAENIPGDTNVLFVPNHQSLLDPVSLIAYFERPISFLSKVEVAKFPVVGKIVQGIDGVFMDRDNMRQEIKAIGKVGDRLEADPRLSYVIFLEGTRTKDKDKEVGDFKAGALKPAYNASKPIVPVAMYGTFRILDQKEHRKMYPVQIKFLKPHDPAEFAEIPTTKMAEIIQSEIATEVRKMRVRDRLLTDKFD